MSVTAKNGIHVTRALPPGVPASILGDEAVAFVAGLHRRFTPDRDRLLAARQAAQSARDAGARLRFLPETRAIRDAAWKIPAPPADLTKRVVEITGPVDRKMIINALNSGADVFMADFEDATSPTWPNLVEGQHNLVDAVRGEIAFDDPKSGKRYRLNDEVATLLVRPRGLHLDEAHLRVDGRPVPGALFDFGLYFFHNARALLERGSGPYFYLPKLESHLEARWWNDVFVHAQERLGIPRGSIRATVLIETLPAAFEMDEILHELAQHSAGLNCGRWDYIFSFTKVHRADPTRVLPDRGQVTMDQGFLRAYARLLIRTCHRRGAHAMGGMAAQIPIKGDDAANEAALEKVRADKRREVEDGHDGTWVAHPALVPIAREVFEARLEGPHQFARLREDVHVTEDELLAPPPGTRTEAGLRWNLRVGVLYLEAWLRGQGCVPLFHLMEDAATAEICRAQTWQWLAHGAALDDGRVVDKALVGRLLGEEIRAMDTVGARLGDARLLFERLCFSPRLHDFLTLEAYPLLDGNGGH